MTWKGGARTSAKGSLRRFESADVDPARVVGLKPDHPAIIEARTLFPSTVVRASDTQRLLVSGHNSTKLGAVVMKGAWRGMPIFQLSLEERATCPASCALWRSCYGNAMHLARRHDHRDPLFLDYLAAELLLLNRAHPKGFAVRLHALGDFYSVDYVRFWADQLDKLAGLRVFGYTARREDADDAQSRQIALALRWLSEQAFDVFAMRFSGRPGPAGTVTALSPEAAGNAILCPAQTHKTDACATCGLCWAPAARDKTIAFLLHGMKPRRKGEGGRKTRFDTDQGAALRAAYEAGATLDDLAVEHKASVTSVRRAILTAGGAMRARAAVIAGRKARSGEKQKGRARSWTLDEARRWRQAYENGDALKDLARRLGRSAVTVRAGIVAAGGAMRSRADGVREHWAQHHAQSLGKATLQAATRAMPPAKHKPSDVQKAKFWGRPAHQRAHLHFEPGEQERLIEDFLRERPVSQCPPAPAHNAHRTQCMVGMRAK